MLTKSAKDMCAQVFAKAFQINRASDISSIAIDTLAFQGTTLPSVLISQTFLGGKVSAILKREKMSFCIFSTLSSEDA